MTTLQRVLIANRGEIAVRLIKACADEDLETVLAASSADMNSLPARLADRVVCIGPAPAAESYLDVNRVLAAAVHTGCDAVHPGYGFLSENPDFATGCQAAGLTFVGPSADTLRRGGDKLAAKAVARDIGVPVGASSEAVVDFGTARYEAHKIGYPVLIKAAAGGGGRGMSVVRDDDELASRLDLAMEEARQAFGSSQVYLERFIENARHVEVQILADSHGTVVHLGERDCSSQRRYQKVVEESPAPDLPHDLSCALRRSAVDLARNLGYTGAGTFEFLVDADHPRDFTFLEMNGRIQVEHPVTEAVTGLDIVRTGLRVAAGADLGFRQSDVRFRGHAIECRITAEDPARDFAPAPGLISRWTQPVGTYVRVDTHCETGYSIPPYYDSLLAKLIVWGDDRDQAIDRTVAALRRFQIEGVTSTAEFLRAFVGHQAFRAGHVSTNLVSQYLAATKAAA